MIIFYYIKDVHISVAFFIVHKSHSMSFKIQHVLYGKPNTLVLNECVIYIFSSIENVIFILLFFGQSVG